MPILQVGGVLSGASNHGIEEGQEENKNMEELKIYNLEPKMNTLVEIVKLIVLLLKCITLVLTTDSAALTLMTF